MTDATELARILGANGIPISRCVGSLCRNEAPGGRPFFVSPVRSLAFEVAAARKRDVIEVLVRELVGGFFVAVRDHYDRRGRLDRLDVTIELTATPQAELDALHESTLALQAKRESCRHMFDDNGYCTECGAGIGDDAP